MAVALKIQLRPHRKLEPTKKCFLHLCSNVTNGEPGCVTSKKSSLEVKKMLFIFCTINSSIIYCLEESSVIKGFLLIYQSAACVSPVYDKGIHIKRQ